MEQPGLKQPSLVILVILVGLADLPGSSRPSTSTAYKVFNGLVAGVTFCLCSPSQRTARAGIAQLTRQQLSELCESKSKKSKAPKESKDFLWTVFWSSLRAGISPFEFSEAAKAAKAKVKGVAKGARVATVALNEKQREALKALRLFDDIFAEALKTEAVKVCEAFELKQLEDEVKEVNAVNDEVLVQLTSTKQDPSYPSCRRCRGDRFEFHEFHEFHDQIPSASPRPVCQWSRC